MATLLEQAISAAKQGRKAEAKSLFEQVLQADDRNERAWLWLSEVADTNFERIAYVERALAINPDNVTSQLALQKLKAQAGQPGTSIVLAAAQPKRTTGLLKNPVRKPFRLTDGTSAANGSAVHHQATVGVSPVAVENGSWNSLKPAASAATASAKPAAPSVDISQAYDLEKMPLFPLLIFSTLCLTAVGGIFMLLLLGILA